MVKRQQRSLFNTTELYCHTQSQPSHQSSIKDICTQAHVRVPEWLDEYNVLLCCFFFTKTDFSIEIIWLFSILRHTHIDKMENSQTTIMPTQLNVIWGSVHMSGAMICSGSPLWGGLVPHWWGLYCAQERWLEHQISYLQGMDCSSTLAYLIITWYQMM